LLKENETKERAPNSQLFSAHLILTGAAELAKKRLKQSSLNPAKITLLEAV
jgi:hypothetical protein